MRKLAYDVCRCLGEGCDKREECLRHTDKAEGAHPRQVAWSENMNTAEKQHCPYFITNNEENNA